MLLLQVELSPVCAEPRTYIEPGAELCNSNVVGEKCAFDVLNYFCSCKRALRSKK